MTNRMKNQLAESTAQREREGSYRREPGAAPRTTQEVRSDLDQMDHITTAARYDEGNLQ